MYKRQVHNIDNNKHVPWSRISVLVVGDNWDDDVTYLGLITNTDRDRTKIINLDKVYEIIIRNNPIDYYGIMEKTNSYGYYTVSYTHLDVYKRQGMGSVLHSLQ